MKLWKPKGEEWKPKREIGLQLLTQLEAVLNAERESKYLVLFNGHTMFCTFLFHVTA